MPDIRDTLSTAWGKALDQLFELSSEEILIMWLAVGLAVVLIILLIRWVD